MVRVDKYTGKQYTYHNIPVGRLSFIQNEKGFFKIFAQYHSHPDNAWYNDSFIGDFYGVFKWVSTGTTTGFFQQVSPWYFKYGNALNKMVKLAEV